MTTAHRPSAPRRLIARAALATSLILAAFAFVASASASGFSVSYTATQFSLFGAAHFERNPLCPDGFMIDQIGFGAANYCTIVVTVPTAGTYNVSFQEETEYPRVMYVNLGSETGTAVTGSPYLITGTSFKTPVEFTAGTIALKAGANTIYFSNSTSGTEDRCPYLSQITISQ